MFGFAKKISFKIRSATASEIGLVRPNNEDHVYVDRAGTLFAVADGMGGGAEGEIASEIVCRELGTIENGGAEFSTRIDALGAALAAANRAVFDHAKAKGLKQMGSTVALLAVEGECSPRAAICHVGDSRVYRVRKDIAELMTQDHSIGAELARKLGGCPNSAVFAKRANPLAHVLTRAIGTEPEVRCEWRKVDLKAGDVYLICTDGVHDVIEATDLPDLIGDDAPEAAVRRISERVVARGAPDNYSMVVVRVEA